MKQPWIKRLTALAMTLCLTAGLSVPVKTYAAGENVITISSEEDWKGFVKNCKLDSWSVGKTVVLEKDLNLKGKFKPIPIFGGTFDGGGHSVYIGTYKTSASDIGLFRYVSKGGTVKDLTVSGTWELSGSKSSVGGLAGVNKGTITGCTFKGAVMGRNNIGGIAGLNEATGLITDCKVFGKIEGEHYTGGITGQNLGGVTGSKNHGSVNTQTEDTDPSLKDMDLKKLNSTKNAPSSTDVGGVAGFSSGVLKDCTNTGKVGYPHVGNNIGGIAGRQCGQLQNCQNSGEVLGKKDVGGVVGQMEPHMMLKFGKDDLERLLDAFSGLQGTMDGLLDDTEGSGDVVSDRIKNISALTDGVRKNTDYLVHHTEDFAEDTITTFNDLSLRADRFLSDINGVLRKGDDLSADLEDSLAELHKSVKKFQNAADAGADVLDSVTGGVNKLDRAIKNFKRAWNHLGDCVHNIGDSLGSWQELKAAVRELKDALDNMNQKAKDIRTALKNLKGSVSDAADSGDDMISEMQKGLSRLDQGLSKMEDAEKQLSDMVTEFRWAVEGFQEGGAPQLPQLSPGYKENTEQLLDGAGAIFDEMDALTDDISAQGDILIGDLRAMNRQMGSIIGIMRDVYDSLLAEDEEDLYEDISETDTASAEGLVDLCRNYGSVEGDVHTGGIAGYLGLEYDFDPKEDTEEKGKRTLKPRYQTKAILSGSQNYGAVTGKKNYVGGAVGCMTMGSLHHCEAYGRIISKEGDYVGGIAGKCETAIRDSAAKVSLEGGRYVGGIAGYGGDVVKCASMVEMEEAEEGIGAIAGKTDGEFTENYFADCEWGGVDDISYAGKAEPLAYEDFIQLDGLPERFRSFYLTFMAKGNVVADVPYHYGDKVKEKEIPEVPEEKGFTGKWEDLPETVTFDRILEAAYVQNNSSIASEETRMDGVRAVMLAEGSFEEDAVVELRDISEQEAGYAGAAGYAEGWEVSVPDDGRKTHLIRYCKPDQNGITRIYQLKDGKAERIQTEKDGQYYCFHEDDNTFSVYCTVIPYVYIVTPFAILLVLVLLAVFLKNREKICTNIREKRAKLAAFRTKAKAKHKANAERRKAERIARKEQEAREDEEDEDEEE